MPPTRCGANWRSGAPGHGQAMSLRPPPVRHCRSNGDEKLPTGAEALNEPFAASFLFPSALGILWHQGARAPMTDTRTDTELAEAILAAIDEARMLRRVVLSAPPIVAKAGNVDLLELRSHLAKR